MKFFRQLRSFFRRQRLDAEMAEEMRQHLELQAERNRAAGMDQSEARYAAERQFGNLASLQEQARAGRPLRWLDDTWHDVRFAGRQCAKTPGFTMTVATTLALGIGACTAMFSVVNAVLLRPLPFPAADQVVQIWDASTPGRIIYPEGLAYHYWRKESALLDAVSIAQPVSSVYSGGPTPEQLTGLRVSANYLHVLGVAPLLGREFEADAEKVGGANDVVVLTHEMWQRRLGGDPRVVNRTVMLDEKPHVVIGVLAPGVMPRDDVQFLIPLVHTPEVLSARGSSRWAQVPARLKPGVTPADAAAELSAILRAHAGEFPPAPGPLTATVIPLREQLVGGARPILLMLLAVGGLVLLIACANVSNLLLVRAIARTKEMAVRTALGAGVSRIVRQVLAENLLLALLGGALGTLLALQVVAQLGDLVQAVDPTAAQNGPPLVSALTGGYLPTMLQPRVDWPVLLFACGAAMATGVGCGLFPALRAARTDVNHDLKDAGRGSAAAGRLQAQSVFVGLEISMAVLLLIGAGLFLRSFSKLASVDPGFDPTAAYAVDLAFPDARYPKTADEVRFTEEVVQRLRELPGLDAVCASSDAPFGGRGLGGGVGRAEEPDRSRDVVAGHQYVTSDFFHTLGIRLIRGRVISALDNQATSLRVMVLSEEMARALFGEEDPIGHRVVFRRTEWEVIGVVGNWKFRSLEGTAARFFYLPFVFNSGRASVIVRSGLPVRQLEETLRTNVRALDPNQPVAMRALTEGIAQSLRGRQSVLLLVNGFASVALVLACLGIYGVMAFTIARRQREVGIRMALGASPPSVVALVLRDGLRPAAAGLIAGVVAAALAAHLIASQLFGISPRDPKVFCAATAAAAVIALFACWFPARRAAKVDPVIALRAD